MRELRVLETRQRSLRGLRGQVAGRSWCRCRQGRRGRRRLDAPAGPLSEQPEQRGRSRGRRTERHVPRSERQQTRRLHRPRRHRGPTPPGLVDRVGRHPRSQLCAQASHRTWLGCCDAGGAAAGPRGALHYAIRHQRAVLPLQRHGADRRQRRRLGRPLPRHAHPNGVSAIEGLRAPVRDDGRHGWGHGGFGDGARGGAQRRWRSHRSLRAGVHGRGAGSRHPGADLSRHGSQTHASARPDSVVYFPGQGCAHLPRLCRAGSVATAGGLHGPTGLGHFGGIRNYCRALRKPGSNPRLPAGVHRRVERIRPLSRRSETPYLLRPDHDLRAIGGQRTSTGATVLHDRGLSRHRPG